MAQSFNKKQMTWSKRPELGMKYAIQLGKLMKERGISGKDLVDITGHTPANISRLRQGKIRSIRFSTLFAICDKLDCSPGDILVRITDEEAKRPEKGVFVINLEDDE